MEAGGELELGLQTRMPVGARQVTLGEAHGMGGEWGGLERVCLAEGLGATRSTWPEP